MLEQDGKESEGIEKEIRETGGGCREGMRRIDFNCLKDEATDPWIIPRIAFQSRCKVRLLILPQCFR